MRQKIIMNFSEVSDHFEINLQYNGLLIETAAYNKK